MTEGHHYEGATDEGRREEVAKSVSGRPSQPLSHASRHQRLLWVVEATMQDDKLCRSLGSQVVWARGVDTKFAMDWKTVQALRADVH